MDGNGRWAARRGLPRGEGHVAGAENIRRILPAAVELGIPYLTLWAFSSDNWRRPEAEVQGIMHLLGEMLVRELGELHRQGVRVRHIGLLDRLPQDTQRRVLDAIALTDDNKRLVLTLAFDYVGRQDVVRAARALVASGIPSDQITEAAVDDHLDTRGLPDPDLIIRTSGEYRMSNFLLWQTGHAELVFSQHLWPDFGPDDLRDAVEAFGLRRQRRD